MTTLRCPVFGKVIYRSFTEAHRHIRLIEQRDRDYRAPGGGKFNAYHCRHCNGFHVGHMKRERHKRVKIRFNITDE